MTIETCPICSQINALEELEEDVVAYRCAGCKNDIRMFSGPYGETYDPHVENTRPHDDEAIWGMWCEGKKVIIKDET